jgi:hypothetical protein
MATIDRKLAAMSAAKGLLWLKRLGWMAAIWAASVAAVALVSVVLRLWLRP